MERLRTQATRLGHTPTTLIGDATRLDWWDGAEFDTVLIDAPCSGSGTLRRHPDIAILRSASDLVGYARLQGQLLTNLWHTLRPGGNLLYCTCSLFTEENDAVIAGFLEATIDAKVEGISFSSGVAREYGWQLLPTESKTDGFYFAALTKTLDKKRK
jgi:16S rRNA (cytosine967-C5)-methyltransferase